MLGLERDTQGQDDELAGWNGYLEGTEDLAVLKEFVCDRYGGEFFWTGGFDPDFIDRCAWEGFLPMACGNNGYFPFGSDHPDVFLPKLHLERCLMFPENLHIPRSALRHARGLELSFNHDFPAVLEACIARHGDDWLRPSLVHVFKRLHADRHVQNWRTFCISTEVREAGTLVAGEIGYVWGGFYTSLSGFTKKNGAGTVQMTAMARILFRHGIRIWDLGMDMPYKRALGAEPYQRRSFIECIPTVRMLPFDRNGLESSTWSCAGVLGDLWQV